MTTPTKEMADAALRNYSQLYNSRGTQTDCNNYPYILRSRIAALEAENSELKRQVTFERSQLLEWYNEKTPRCVDTDAGRVYGSHEAIEYVWASVQKNRALEDENEKLKAAQQWQPISSAPKDGIFFLATDHKQVWITRVAFTNSGKARNRFTSAPYGLLGGRPNKATHWMPLPEPPKEGV